MVLNEEQVERVQELLHSEELFFKTLSFLSGYLIDNGVGYDDEIDIYKKIGFTDDDLDYFELRDYDLEEEIYDDED